MPPQQLKISGKYVSLYLPCLKEHIRVFIIIFRPKLQELCGVEVAPPCRQGPIHTSCTIVEWFQQQQQQQALPLTLLAPSTPRVVAAGT
jgi:hypothetical protein